MFMDDLDQIHILKRNTNIKHFLFMYLIFKNQIYFVFMVSENIKYEKIKKYSIGVLILIKMLKKINNFYIQYFIISTYL